MKGKISNIYTLIMVLSMLMSCDNSSNKTSIRIATASNLQFVMDALVSEFSNKNQIDCELVFSSSGKLTAQINEGAPYDIFLSANMIYPNALEKAGKTYKQPKVYAFGKLVLWTMDTRINPSIDNLSHSIVEHIALANPKTAPYGKAAIETLNYYKALDPIKSKLVYGESISQTNQFINSGSAQMGFTSKSVVLSKSMKNKGNWIEIDELAYKPIEQGIVIVKHPKKDMEAALKFYNFMFSAEAKIILTQFGYQVSE